MRKLSTINVRIVGVREDRSKLGTASCLLAEFYTAEKCRPVMHTIVVQPGAMTARQQESMIALQKMKRFIPYYAEISYTDEDKWPVNNAAFVRWRTAQDVARCAP